MLNNIILKSDSYKVSHYRQYPKGTEKVFSYLEARTKKGEDQDIIFFGLQYIIKKHLWGIVLTQEMINDAQEILDVHLGKGLFNRAGWELLLKKHNGMLPIEIRAVKEGSINKRGDVLITVVNTDPEFYWLTNYIETLLVQAWYPITVCSQSYAIKQTIKSFLEKTGDVAGLPFKLHDFGFRGVSSSESSAIGGAAHLVNFMGTDTMSALELLIQYYGAGVCGFSIPASEHSTMTSWGSDHEVDAMRNMLEQYPTGIIACVSDSYNIYKACEDYWGNELREMILDRDGTLVVRPDSGDPTKVILKCLLILANAFGYKDNALGYRVLPSQIRLIQGDGVDHDAIKEILRAMKIAGWSADNIAFGMGGGLLQKLDRDTFSFAFKCSAIQKHGEWLDVWKEPVTDPHKNSKRGKLDSPNLQTVFKNGQLLVDWIMDDIRGVS